MSEVLREMVAKIFLAYDAENDHPLEVADRILAIPEIAEGLEMREAAARQGMKLQDGSLGVEYNPRPQ